LKGNNMKKLFKLIAIFGMLMIGASIFAQSQLSYATVDKYQAKYTEDNWGEWKDIEGEIIIYLDMGFGFMAITNSNFDRLILTKMEDPVETEKKISYVFEAKD